MTDLAANPAIRTLCRLLSEHTGQHLSTSRLWRVETALRPLMRQRRIADLDMLVDLIKRGDEDMLAHALDAMLNHESSFFRDLSVFQSIERDILPDLRETGREKVLRIWSAGCATGKEPYSLAMMLKRMAPAWDGWRISILATDVSSISIETAQSGLYSQMDVQRGLGIDDLLRWFEPSGEEWQVSSELGNMIHFRADNLLDPKVVTGQFDLILCRNVMLYFPDALRLRACEVLAQHIRPGGFLVLGAGEALLGREGRFMPSPDYRCAYQADDRLDRRCAG